MSASYTASPVRPMVAAYCACCGRPLVEAESVETGVGPVCRSKHGYTKPDRAADWPAALVLLDSLLEAERVFGGSTETLEAALKAQDAQTLVNVLAYRAALVASVSGYEERAVALSCMRAIYALGYVTFAQRMAKHGGFGVIFGELLDGGRVAVSTPYRAEATGDWRAIPSRRWDAGRKANVVAARDLHLVRELVARHWPHAILELPVPPVADESPADGKLQAERPPAPRCDGRRFRGTRYPGACAACGQRVGVGTGCAYQAGGKWRVCCAGCADACGVVFAGPAPLPERLDAAAALAFMRANGVEPTVDGGKVLRKGGRTCGGCRGTGRYGRGTCAACGGRRVTRDTWVAPQAAARELHRRLTRRAEREQSAA